MLFSKGTARPENFITLNWFLKTGALSKHQKQTDGALMNVQSSLSRKHCLVSRFHIKINDYSFFVDGLCRCSISGHNNILISLDLKKQSFAFRFLFIQCFPFKISKFHVVFGELYSSFASVWSKIVFALDNLWLSLRCCFACKFQFLHICF